MHYFLIRNGIIENRIVWDGETPFDPGEDAKIVPVDDLPDNDIGDQVEEVDLESEEESEEAEEDEEEAPDTEPPNDNALE